MSASKPEPADRSTRERFLVWLLERDPELAGRAPTALERLGELGGLEREGAAFARILAESGEGDEESETLLQVHAAWTRFRRREREKAREATPETETVAWVGVERKEGAEGKEGATGLDGGVEWIEAEDLPSTPPEGVAPSLLAAGQRPRQISRPKRGLLRPSDLLVPLALVLSLIAVFVPAVVERRSVQGLRAEALALLKEELSRGTRPDRLAWQAGLGAWLARARQAQGEAVRSTCEAGRWCRQRLAALERSRQLALALAEDARARGIAAPEAGWRPPETMRRALLGELEAVARGAADEAHDEGLATHHLQVVDAERSALAQAGVAP